MKKAIIWDLDGTLLDSYQVIIDSLYLTFQQFGGKMTRDEIWQYAITYSSSALIEHFSAESGTPPQLLLDSYAQISRSKYLDIIPMEHARETLDALCAKGMLHFVYTHRGTTTMPVLQNLSMDGYFVEVLTSRSGFARKPNPEAIEYLIEKYELSREHTYYAGDRTLDMECAQNAGISGILYLPKGSRGRATDAQTYIVDDLLQIVTLL